ncbi:hypothetical protein NHH03_06220 [Stieleria sp. TO1_6]|uniref:hypothetical protein n=1 Tax=Stieleria tagensis TaxID=2956795 RepID=UPI00209ACA97|nr:hypothetical protein [Stieleria tagensis]MCO8121325.1 hypothetical protein [Stieleria tagensis]
MKPSGQGLRLTDAEKQDIIRHLDSGKPLPDKYRFLLFEDKREVELVWNGKTNEVCNVVLPFQTIEQVDEPRAESEADAVAESGADYQPTLFSLDERGRQLRGWTNKLIWGDNKLVLSSLKSGPMREEKSVFNRIVGDSHLELEFAAFLEGCDDVTSFAKNYFAVHFKLDYVNASGNISNYYPDFIVRLVDGRVLIIETKGLEDLDVPLKMARLKQWCQDINAVSNETKFDFVFVDEEGFRKFSPISCEQLLKSFTDYK